MAFTILNFLLLFWILVGVTKRELLEEGQLKRREGQAQCSRLLGFIHISLSPHSLSLSRALSSSDFEF
ncbi:unnamed protein product [Prunus armeniaca]|uniref:Uncharacterized protein n=1 Tax=Prunus armeniaca TaxID=36596 RepID=A0A6J5W6T3_PRUAR|nr:unnamed protein product [Prunus armeniaca]